jgi:calnexin
LLIDGEEKAGGRIDDAGAFEPPLRPPRELPDPGDAPPADWDEREE